MHYGICLTLSSANRKCYSQTSHQYSRTYPANPQTILVSVFSMHIDWRQRQGGSCIEPQPLLMAFNYSCVMELLIASNGTQIVPNLYVDFVVVYCKLHDFEKKPTITIISVNAAKFSSHAFQKDSYNVTNLGDGDLRQIAIGSVALSYMV